MNRMEVLNISITPDYTLYSIGCSELGRAKPGNHPARFEMQAMRLKGLVKIEQGDILRCDGLPYTSKPRELLYIKGWEVFDQAFDNGIFTHLYIRGKYWRRVPLGTTITRYSPVKVADGLWALRKNNEKK